MRTLLHVFFWCGTLLGLLIILPFMFLLYVVLVITQGMPVFFLQKRIGKDGKPFNIIKFRTMIIGADKIGDGLWGGGVNDSRYTPLGNFMRKTKLDELPQLVNVIKGDMALVGPRPPVEFTYDLYSKFYLYVLREKPGITGPTQVGGGNNLTRSERLKADIEYANSCNAWGDIIILFRTFSAVFFPPKDKMVFSQENIEDMSSEKEEILSRMMVANSQS